MRVVWNNLTTTSLSYLDIQLLKNFTFYHLLSRCLSILSLMISDVTLVLSRRNNKPPLEGILLVISLVQFSIHDSYSLLYFINFQIEVSPKKSKKSWEVVLSVRQAMNIGFSFLLVLMNPRKNFCSVN